MAFIIPAAVLDQLGRYGESPRDDEPGFTPMGWRESMRGYQPPDPPRFEPEMVDLSPEDALDIYLELQRQVREYPRGSAERKRGTASKTVDGKRYVYDKYGGLTRRGFQPNRQRGRAFNVAKYLFDKQSGALAADRESMQQDTAKRARERAMQSDEFWREYQAREAGRQDYNQMTYRTHMADLDQQRWMEEQSWREEMKRMQLEQQLAMRELAGRPDPERERYYGAQADYLGYLMEHGLDKTGRPMAGPGSKGYAGMQADELLERRDYLQRRLTEIGEALAAVGDLERQASDWIPWNEAATAEVYHGGEKLAVPRGGAQRYRDVQLPKEYMDAMTEYSAIDAQLQTMGFPSMPWTDSPVWSDEQLGTMLGYGGQGEAAGQAGGARRPDPASPAESAGAGAPQIQPGVGGAEPDAEDQYPLAEGPPGPAGLMERSKMAGRRQNPLTMPNDAQFERLDPLSQSFYAVLEDLQAQGYNIADLDVQRFAMERAREMDAAYSRGGARPPAKLEGPQHGGKTRY